MTKLAEALETAKITVDGLDDAKKSELHDILKADVTELAAYQNAQARAFSSGAICLEDAQFLYRTFGGECPSSKKWDEIPLAEKIVATKAVVELVEMLLQVKERGVQR